MTLTAAIVGTGNIGTDLLVKARRSQVLDVRWMAGVDPQSKGLAKARELGVKASSDGVDWLLSQRPSPDLVFEATSAAAHLSNAPRYRAAGIRAIDLTPAAVGPFVCPPVNLDADLESDNLNMITCGGQATIPIVHAVNRVVDVEYAEIVASIASRSAGPGTRANIDEFTVTTARAIESVGGAGRGKAVIILNPVEPPMIMRDTVFCSLPSSMPSAGYQRVLDSITEMVEEVQKYVPGYRLRKLPQIDEARPEWPGGRVTVLVEVRGNGDYLPDYAGNLDIMTAAAIRTGEKLALKRREGTGK